MRNRKLSIYDCAQGDDSVRRFLGDRRDDQHARGFIFAGEPRRFPGGCRDSSAVAKAKAEGVAVVLDVQSEHIMAAVGIGRDVNALVLPPGAEAAVRLRRKLGAEQVLAGLRKLGLGAPPGSFTLHPDTDDSSWGNVLSMGESDITVTPEQVAQFLGAIGRRSDETGQRMRVAMLDAVTQGSAAGVAPRLAGIDWQLGGKIGTGPASAKPNYDGWFAGLIFQQCKPRYAVCIYVPGRGRGGGVAAGIAADLTRWFAGAR